MPKPISGNTVNDKLGEAFVSLTANIERLSASETIVVTGILKDLELDIVGKLQANPDMTSWRKSRYNALLAQVKDQIASTYGKITDREQKVLAEAAEATGKATAKIFEGIGIPLQSVIVTPDQWQALASKSLVQGAPSASWWKKQDQDLQDAFIRQMRMGYASGESIDQLVARVRGTATGKRNKYEINGKEYTYVEFKGGIMDTDTRHAAALVRTSIQQVSADAKLEMFKKNADILKGIMWLSTLDSRTTYLCRARSGLLYDLDGKPIGHDQSFLGGPPSHWQCRSTLVPVTKSFEELGGTPGITAEYLDAIGPGTQASMNGEVPADLTFDKWFHTLPEDDQKAFLGKKKYEIWKKAGLNFQDMVDQRGNPLTIKQLSEAYGFKIKESVESGIPNIPKEMVSAIAVEQQAQLLASKMVQEITDETIKQGKKEWETLQNEVKLVLDKDTLNTEARMKELALERSRNADDTLLMATYDSQLAQLETENSAIEKELRNVRNKDAIYAELEKQWLGKMREYNREIPYWDMRQYQRELDEYVQAQNTSALETMLTQPKRTYDKVLQSNVLEIINKQEYKGTLQGIKKLKAFELEKEKLIQVETQAQEKIDALLQEADYKATYKALKTDGKLPILKKDILQALKDKFAQLNKEAEDELIKISKYHSDSLEYKAYLRAESRHGEGESSYSLLRAYRRSLQRMTKRAAQKYNEQNNP